MLKKTYLYHAFVCFIFMNCSYNGSIHEEESRKFHNIYSILKNQSVEHLDCDIINEVQDANSGKLLYSGNCVVDDINLKLLIGREDKKLHSLGIDDRSFISVEGLSISDTVSQSSVVMDNAIGFFNYVLLEYDLLAVVEKNKNDDQWTVNYFTWSIHLPVIRSSSSPTDE